MTMKVKRESEGDEAFPYLASLNEAQYRGKLSCPDL